MKKILLLSAFVFLISFSNSFATTRIIMVEDFMFGPVTTNAFVGDTIKYQWMSGTHTTTCNGTGGTSLPPGATPWDASMTSSSPTFLYRITVAGTYNYICTRHPTLMTGTIVATTSVISPISQNVPEKFSLAQNYPNPFNPSTVIRFDIAKSGLTKLTISDLSGREVSELVNENLTPGSYQINFNASNISSGVYFYRLQTEGFVEIKKMIFMK